ncbi:hypothetical protein [Candidatus Laterigemmans baculatus]|uniref:hypothetical protein n=1 Tax=Candidatus Laterigemmans baculatus TaxID=2770505 RepID=UPI0013DD27E9|nr:hypothetical protein [Candidatus Laterigemmans baculatus]
MRRRVRLHRSGAPVAGAAGIEASNYREGILGWCRAGLPLETDDHQPTNAVHPYWRVFTVPEHYEVRM